MEEKFTILEIVETMVGKVMPIGETFEDDERFENLKKMCDITQGLIETIKHVSEKNSYEYSVKRASDYAEKFLKERIGIQEKNKRR